MIQFNKFRFFDHQQSGN